MIGRRKHGNQYGPGALEGPIHYHQTGILKVETESQDVYMIKGPIKSL
jgi:hypothetical protein